MNDDRTNDRAVIDEENSARVHSSSRIRDPSVLKRARDASGARKWRV
jgi:hypothetical protein